MNLEDYFGTISAMLGASLLITGWITTQVIKDGSNTVNRIVSWLVPIALSFAGKALGLGMFETMTVLWTAINGLGIALAANGVFDITFIQQLLALIGARKKESIKK